MCRDYELHYRFDHNRGGSRDYDDTSTEDCKVDLNRCVITGFELASTHGNKLLKSFVFINEEKL